MTPMFPVIMLMLQGPSFDFVHVSDTHVEARAAENVASKSIRGQDTFDWIAGALASSGPRPEFVLATGDLTEFGTPGDTWLDVERLFAKLPMPWYPVMGNHDQTWNPIDRPYFARLDELEVRLRAGRSYLRRDGTWALAVLDSASLFEPRPSFDAGELAEIESKLGKFAWGVPVVVALHHPPDSAEFAQPFSSRMLFSALDGLDLELILYGHGHTARHHRVFGVDCVQGGSTFASKDVDERGFGRVTAKDGILRSTYRYLDPARGERVLVERQLHASEGPRSLTVKFEHPTQDQPGRLVAQLSSAQDSSSTTAWRVLVDGEVVADAKWTSVACTDCDRREVPLDTLYLGDGLRLVTVEVDRDSERVRQRSITLDGTCVRALRPLEPQRGPDGHPMFVPAPRYPHWFPTANQADRLDWRIEPLFRDTLPGRPLRVGNSVWLGDADGRVHKVELGPDPTAWTQRIVWSTSPIGMAIESAPALAGDLIVVGAWDGNLHAFDAQTGEPKWTVSGPKSSEGGAARYYAPADCSPVVLHDRIYACDRGYALAWYSLTGEMHRLPHASVAGIGASESGEHLLLRGTDDVLTRVDRDGEVVWTAHVLLGRTPVPPLEKDGIVHVVSDQGVYSRVNGNTGGVLTTVSASATAFVFAPPMLHEDGSVEIRSQAGTQYHWRPEHAASPEPASAGPR